MRFTDPHELFQSSWPTYETPIIDANFGDSSLHSLQRPVAEDISGLHSNLSSGHRAQSLHIRPPQPFEHSLVSSHAQPPAQAVHQSHGHNKNVSISTHLGQFSMADPGTSVLRPRPSRESAVEVAQAGALPEGGFDDTFKSLLQEMVHLDSEKLNAFQVRVLEQLLPSISLDDFYNLLYNADQFPSMKQIGLSAPIDRTDYGDASRSIATLQALLRAFQDPTELSAYLPTVDTGKTKLPSIIFHELLRSFLAVKILNDVLVEVPRNTVTELPTIPRFSIYKAYFVICHKLILKYPTVSNSTSLQQKLILGQSKVGKLLKLVYPNVVSKRLGQRGKSKYNYLGLRWNEKVIDPGIIALTDNELDELAAMFKAEHRREIASKPQLSPRKRLSLKRLRSFASDLEPVFSSHSTHTRFSFINGQVMLPETDVPFFAHLFSPLGSKSWLAEQLANAFSCLHVHGVDIDTLRRLSDPIFYTNERWLLESITALVQQTLLDYTSLPRLSLFLAISLQLMIPLRQIASGVPDQRSSFRQNMSHLVGNILYHPLLEDDSNLHSFGSLLRRILRLNDTLVSLSTSTSADVFRKTMRAALNSDPDSQQDSQLQKMFSRCFIYVLRSYQFEFYDNGVPMSDENIVLAIDSHAREFEASVGAQLLPALELLGPDCGGSQLLKLFDEFVLRQHWTSRYHLQILQLLVELMLTEVVRYLQQHNSGFAPGDLRHWWLGSSLCVEYFAILSEMVGLSHQTQIA